MKTNLEVSKVSAMYTSNVFLSVNCILSEENKQQVCKILVHFTAKNSENYNFYFHKSSIYVKTLYK